MSNNTNTAALNTHGAELQRSSSKDYPLLTDAMLRDFGNMIHSAIEEKKEVGSGLSDMASAIATIAVYFHDDQADLYEEEDSEWYHPNNLQFQLRGVFQQLMRNASFMTEQASRRLDTLENITAATKRKALGGEIDIEELKRVVRQLKRQSRVVCPVTEQYRQMMTVAYEAAVGEAFRKPVPAGETPEAQELRAVLAEIENL